MFVGHWVLDRYTTRAIGPLFWWGNHRERAGEMACPLVFDTAQMVVPHINHPKLLGLLQPIVGQTGKSMLQGGHIVFF